ncbi:uncharacterized protein CLUP02_01493 [Colletotrichum lupini]|uniref:Uncharacterized protein n=1 Tax=Colletotrichum lupini TaxID=145971 RepID=A0A9Q8W9C4_9PEZI|nr:uncharacterized protein CLUP02_01493 [Colletotrichum lupini]UQC74841.1 hypothetical protein CLUP02_01493 [Colletotrichum lupini]
MGCRRSAGNAQGQQGRVKRLGGDKAALSLTRRSDHHQTTNTTEQYTPERHAVAETTSCDFDAIWKFCPFGRLDRHVRWAESREDCSGCPAC